MNTTKEQRAAWFASSAYADSATRDLIADVDKLDAENDRLGKTVARLTAERDTQAKRIAELEGAIMKHKERRDDDNTTDNDIALWNTLEQKP